MTAEAIAARPTERAEPAVPAARFVATGDAGALAVLAGLTTLVAGNRFAFDGWLARMDLATFFLPWYAFLGERLRAFAVPGWNPHLFSGTPFAGDPGSGWMYLPALLVFPLLPILGAFKAMVALQLGVAGLSTYAFARLLGMGPAAGLVAAVAYAFGPFLEWNTSCCLIFAQFATWIPLALLGVELALRGRRWRDRLAPWSLTGFAISQMFAGWVGEGWLYALLLPAAYTGYRTLLAPPNPELRPLARLTTGAATGLAGPAFGLALGAAGLLPRLAVNAETHLAGANYAALGADGILNRPWAVDYLLVQVMGMGTGYHFRAAGFGGAVIVLALLAPVLARRRFAVPFFAGLTLVAMILALDTTPLHRLFYLIPRYQALHEHDPWRSFALAAIGPAMLGAAAVESLPNWRGRRRLLPVVAAPVLLMAIAATALGRLQGIVGWAPLLAAATSTALVAAVVLAPRDRPASGAIGRIVNGVPVLALAVVFVQPTGLELTGSWLGWPPDPRWTSRWRPDPSIARALAVEVAGTDPAAAGEYLQRQMAAAGPFRYVGYGGVRHARGNPSEANYMGRWSAPNVQAILVNGRPMYLGLDEIQGYNPLQLARYAEFMTALNGEPTNYHVAYLLPSGTRSPLLDLLDVRYVLVDATLPPDRADVAALTAGRRLVLHTEHVAIYERPSRLGHAWIVHEVRAVEPGEPLRLLAGGSVDPRRTALVEGAPPGVVVPADPRAERAVVTGYEPDALTIATRAAAPGLLVVSEVYESGWRAYVDGAPAAVLPTDHVLRGVPIPAGEHTVELRYEPVALRLGLVISGLATLVMVVVFVAGAMLSRLRSGCSPSCAPSPVGASAPGAARLFGLPSPAPKRFALAQVTAKRRCRPPGRLLR